MRRPALDVGSAERHLRQIRQIETDLTAGQIDAAAADGEAGVTLDVTDELSRFLLERLQGTSKL